MEIIVIVYFFTYYSCFCSFKSARFVLIVQSMHFGTAFTDCNSICQIEDGGHACGAMTYHNVIRSLRHVNITQHRVRFLGESKNGFVISDHTDSSLPNKTEDSWEKINTPHGEDEKKKQHKL